MTEKLISTTAKKRGRPPAKRAAAAILEEPAAAPPLARSKHTVVTQWDELKPIEEENEEIEIAPALLNFDEYADDDESIEDALDEIGTGSETWTLVVNAIEEYERHQSASIRYRVFCGNLPIHSAEYLRSQAYLEDIQARWVRSGAKRYFFCQVKKGARLHPQRMPVVGIEPLDPISAAAKAAQPAAAPVAYGLPAPAQADDGLGSLIKQARQFATLRDLLSPQGQPGAAQPAASAAAPDTLESSLLKIANADGDMLEKAAGKIRNLLRGGADGGRETTFMDIGLAFIQNFNLKDVIHEARALAAEVRGQAAPPGLQTAPAAAPLETPKDPTVILSGFLLNACQDQTQWPPLQAARWIADFERTQPTITPYLNYILDLEPAAALAMFKNVNPQASPILDNPATLPWLTAVYEELTKEDDDESAGGQGEIIIEATPGAAPPIVAG